MTASDYTGTPIEHKIVAKVVYFIKGDETAAEYQSLVIEHEGAQWLVATCWQQIATGKKYPDRIVPMSKLPHVVQPDGLIRLGLIMPKELLSDQCPPELLRRFGAQTYPGLSHMPGPTSSH